MAEVITFTPPLTTDADVGAFEPALKNSTKIVGQIDAFHVTTSMEIAREIRIRWWSDVIRENFQFERIETPEQERKNNVPMKTLAGMDCSKLSRDQLKNLAVYRLLAWHVWPMLDTHNEEQTYAQKRTNYWKEKYEEELKSLLQNGIGYDWDGSGSVVFHDEASVGRTKSARLERE